MKIIEIEQNTPEWLDFRQDKIGASDCPIIMKCSPYCSPLILWGQKLGLIPPQPTNPYMQRGKDLEDLARREFCKDMDHRYFAAVGQSEKYSWMIASFDGLGEDGSILEIKCNGKKNHEIAMKGRVPDAHMLQMQHQLYVAEAVLGYYYSFDDVSGIKIKVARNDHQIGLILQKELEFWECLENLTAPM